MCNLYEIVEFENLRMKRNNFSDSYPTCPPSHEDMFLGDDIFGLYRHDTKRYKRIDDDTMLSLVEQLQEGISAQGELDSETQISDEKRIELARTAAIGMRARNSIVEANTGLVFKWARINKGQGVDEEDLIQEGNLGLIRAAEMFNPTGGAQFSTYATRRIRADIGKAILNMSRTVRIPHDKSLLLKTMKKIEAEHFEKSGSNMTVQELAEAMNISVEDAEHFRTMEVSVISYHYSHDDGKGNAVEFSNVIPDPKTPTSEQVVVASEEKNSLSDEIQKMLETSSLNDQEKEMLWLYFAEAQDPDTVATLKLSKRSQTTRIANSAMKKIRADLELDPEKKSHYESLLSKRF